MLDITHDALCAMLWQEVQDHKDFYTEYLQATSDVETDISNYINDKSYNNETGDIIVPALCNALEISAIIYVHKDGQTNIIAHGQSRQGSFRGDIYLGISTNEVDSHYNWLKKHQLMSLTRCSRETTPSFKGFHLRRFVPPLKRHRENRLQIARKSAKQRYSLSHLKKMKLNGKVTRKK